MEPSGFDMCCNPFNKHEKPISKSLEKITAADKASNSSLTIGLFWCDTCRKQNVDQRDNVLQTDDVLQVIECSDIQVPSTSLDQSASASSTKRQRASTSSTEPEEEFCCNPHNRHGSGKRKINSILRKINASDVKKNSSLIKGTHWCDSCRKFTPQQEGAKEPDSLEVDSQHEASLEDKIKDLDCSSIQVPSKRRRKEVSPPPVEEIENVCCNPYKIHSFTISKDLREIKPRDVEKNPLLVTGLHWCSTCRKANPKDHLDKLNSSFSEAVGEFGLADLFADIARDIANEEAGNDSEPNSQQAQCESQTSGSTGSSGLSPTIQKEAASRILKSFGLSPLATNVRRKKGLITIAKNKIDAAANIIRKKVCRAHGMDPEELESTDAVKAKDHDLLMDQIKDKLPSASKLQRYQLLSLVPLSMSVNKAAVQFGVGRTLVSNSRKLRIEKGILPIPDFTRESSVLESTKILVKEFYCREDNCKILPGSRDCVSVGKGVYEQKRLLLSNLSELYQSFKKEYESLKIGISTFVTVRPKWCVFPGSAGTHEQCICQIHQNFKLVLHALNIRKHYRDLIKLCVCSVEDQTCMLKICEGCPNLEKVQEIIRKETPLPDLPDPFD